MEWIKINYWIMYHLLTINDGYWTGYSTLWLPTCVCTGGSHCWRQVEVLTACCAPWMLQVRQHVAGPMALKDVGSLVRTMTGWCNHFGTWPKGKMSEVFVTLDVTMICQCLSGCFIISMEWCTGLDHRYVSWVPDVPKVLGLLNTSLVRFVFF